MPKKTTFEQKELKSFEIGSDIKNEAILWIMKYGAAV